MHVVDDINSPAGGPGIDPAVDSLANSLGSLLGGFVCSHTSLKFGLEIIQPLLKLMCVDGVDGQGDGAPQHVGGRLGDSGIRGDCLAIGGPGGLGSGGLCRRGGLSILLCGLD